MDKFLNPHLGSLRWALASSCSAWVQHARRPCPLRGCAPACTAMRAVFLFFYFLFLFFTKIYFRFRNLQKYTPTAPLPGGRDLAARQQGLIRKKRRKKIADRSLGPAARLRGGRPPPLYKVLAAPHPPFGLLKIQKKRKDREGWGRGKAAKPCRIFKPATLGN